MPPLRVLLSSLLLFAAVVLASDDARSSNACGTPANVDRQAAVAGRSIRVLYAIPSDGVDRGAASADTIRQDVAAISAWWRDQDPAREPRFDEWIAPCGPTPDIGRLRLPDSGAVLRALPGRTDRITRAALLTGDGSPFVKHLVYYDGPVDGSVCGQGGGQADGYAIAVVFVSACPEVPTAVVAAHELIHALGGAPREGSPHACPESALHVCDSTNDILYPAVPRRPLPSIDLDRGRDDYYGHSGSWPDLEDSRWLRRVDRQVTLTVVVDGKGEVWSDLPGVSCSRPCTTTWDAGTFVTLRVRPATGQRFLGWRGVCSGIRRCSVEPNGPTRVRALFGPTRN